MRGAHTLHLYGSARPSRRGVRYARQVLDSTWMLLRVVGNMYKTLRITIIPKATLDVWLQASNVFRFRVLTYIYIIVYGTPATHPLHDCPIHGACGAARCYLCYHKSKPVWAICCRRPSSPDLTFSHIFIFMYMPPQRHILCMYMQSMALAAPRCVNSIIITQRQCITIIRKRAPRATMLLRS